MSKDIDDVTNDIVRIDISEDDNTVSPPLNSRGGAGKMVASEKKCTSCEQRIEHETEDDGSNTDNDIVSNSVDTSICANCGKDGASNVCNKCNQVKYCNAACKKKHRHKHKKDCEEHLTRAAELRDIELFKQPPLFYEECPICFLLLPNLMSGKKYQSCCGKWICSGCIHAMDEICPFCRTPTPNTNDEVIKRARKLLDVGDAEAIFIFGSYYSRGLCGLPQDRTKALELYHRAAELGHAPAYHNIGWAYQNGCGVERDMKKAVRYWELAAMGGHTAARHNLGAFENNTGNIDRALRHYMISVGGGCHLSLREIQKLYKVGSATKDVYTKALRSYQEYLVEVKSNQRDEASAAREDYKYYA